MPASTAEFVMSYLTDGRYRRWPVEVNLVIEELDSWMNPEGALAIPTIWSKTDGPQASLEVAVP